MFLVHLYPFFTLLYGKLPHHLAGRVSDKTDVIKYILDRFKQMVQSKTCGHAESLVENVRLILD